MTNPELKPIVDLIESLARDMHQQFAVLNEKFDRQDARLSRHGGILNGGARQMARLIDWSETLDDMLAERDRRINDLEARLRRLEGR